MSTIAPADLRATDYRRVPLDAVFGPTTADLMCGAGLWTFGDLLDWLGPPTKMAPKLRSLVTEAHAEPELARWLMDLTEGILRRNFPR